MTVYAIVLINENISEKERAFDGEGNPLLEKELVRLAKEGITAEGESLAKINYVQNATGACDYIIQFEADNVEKIMRSVNIIRRIQQVEETETHVGDLLYKKNG